MTAQPITAAEGLAIWIAQTHPDLFRALVLKAHPPGLAGFTDVLSSIGSGITSGIKAVGSYIASTDGVKTLSALAGSYLQNRQQQSVLDTQIKLAEMGQAPAPISYTTDPTTGALRGVYSPVGSQSMLLDQSILDSLAPAPFYKRYAVPLTLGVGAIAVFLVLRKVRFI